MTGGGAGSTLAGAEEVTDGGGKGAGCAALTHRLGAAGPRPDKEEATRTGEGGNHVGLDKGGGLPDPASLDLWTVVMPPSLAGLVPLDLGQTRRRLGATGSNLNEPVDDGRGRRRAPVRCMLGAGVRLCVRVQGRNCRGKI